MSTDHLRRRLVELAEEYSVPGAQLAIHHGGGTWAFEIGEEEHGTSRRMTAASKVPIGSVSKACTAALAMMLATDGDAELDAPIVAYLPELSAPTGGAGGRRADAGWAAQVTLRHLLSHTSGLPCDPREDADSVSLRRHALDCCRGVQLLHRPGAGFSYSNIGYLLAGRVIEVVTGMTWWEAVDALLFTPLGIAPRFVAAPLGAPRAGLVAVCGHAVNRAREQVRPVAQSLSVADAPAGAIAASALDLITIGRMLAAGRPSRSPGQSPSQSPSKAGPALPAGTGLVGDAELRAMRTPVPAAEPFGMADGWGLGLALHRHGGAAWWGHDGTADGTACHLRFEPESGCVVALTTNGSTGFAMWRRLVPELRAAGIPVGSYDDRPALRRKAGRPGDCTGRFVNGDTEYRVRAADSRRLFLTVDGEAFGELTPFEGLHFSIRDAESGDLQAGRFLTDPNTGRIGWIQVGGRLGRRSDRVRDVA